jgi:hypothetical protein
MTNTMSLAFKEDTKYAENISPYLFKNSGKIKVLWFEGLSDTFVQMNKLSFNDSELENNYQNGFNIYF